MLQRVSGALFVAFLVFVTALAQGQPIELIAPPPRSAAPGEIITLTFLAINRGTAPDTYLFSVSAPAGFQTLGALPPLTLAAGAQEPVFVTLIISQETPAGTYSVTLEATSQSDPSVRATAQATVIVERVAGVVVRAPDAQEVDPGSEVVLSFSVTNRGNVIDAFRLEAFTPRGFFTKVEPGIVELLPGETRSVLVTVRVPPDVPAGFEAVTLTAVSLRSEGVQGSGATTLIILPPEASKVPTALYLQAPAELSLGANIDLRQQHSHAAHFVLNVCDAARRATFQYLAEDFRSDQLADSSDPARECERISLHVAARDVLCALRRFAHAPVAVHCYAASRD
jgi:hypothetical protein